MANILANTSGTAGAACRVDLMRRLRTTPSRVIRNRGWLRWGPTPASWWAVRMSSSGTRMEEAASPSSARLTTYMAINSGLPESGSRPRLAHHWQKCVQAER